MNDELGWATNGKIEVIIIIIIIIITTIIIIIIHVHVWKFT